MTDLERVVALSRKNPGRARSWLDRHFPERPLEEFDTPGMLIKQAGKLRKAAREHPRGYIGSATEAAARGAGMPLETGRHPGAGKALTKGANVYNPPTAPGKWAGRLGRAGAAVGRALDAGSATEAVTSPGQVRPYTRVEHGREEQVGGYQHRTHLTEHLIQHLSELHGYEAPHNPSLEYLEYFHRADHQGSPPMGHDFEDAEAVHRRYSRGRTGLSALGKVLALAGPTEVKEFTRVVRGKEQVVRPHMEQEAGWQHPFDVGGHSVQAVYTHPAIPHALYDLGNGLHAEGRAGRGKAAPFRAGPVMRSDTGMDEKALAEKGWTKQKPPAPVQVPKAKGASPVGTASGLTPAQSVAKVMQGTKNAGKGAARPYGPRGKPRPGSQAAMRQAYSDVARAQMDYMQRAGYNIDPHDWSQDWVPPHEQRISPDVHPSGDIKDLNKPGRPLGTATGTAADPIDVKGNIQEALRQLALGNHVRLNQPTELTLLMQEIARHAAETNAGKPADAPDWDFGRLSVKGTNLFAAQNRGIARIHMPQFSGLAVPGTHAEQVAGGPGKFADLTDEFEQHLRDRGVPVVRTTMPASHLKATQTQLVGAKVAGFANAFLHGVPKAVTAMKEPIMVTRDGYVIDGHHRWGANMLADAVDGRLGNDTPMNVRRVDMDIGAMIPLANHWAQQVGIASAAAKAGDTGAALKAK
jgi:hypothetical protein